MTNIKVLDCTLRDGGYLVDLHFNENTIHNIANGLTQAGIDYIELGFLRDTFNELENVCFNNSIDARKYIPKNRKNALYAVIADYGRYNISDLDDYDGLSFDCVRACFHKNERKAVLEFCREIKRKGYRLFVQPMGILYYSTSEILDLINDFNEIDPYCLGIVDSYGSMYLEDLRLKLAVIHSELSPNIKLGFHSHNNKELSNALAMEFINLMKGERDISVDTTLYGMGRGAGNTRTEVIVDYLNKKIGKNYDLDIILDVIDNSISNIALHKKWGYDLHMYLAGIHGTHVNNVDYLMEKAGLRTKDISWILSRLSDNERVHSDNSRLDELYHECLQQLEISEDNLESLKTALQGKSILIVIPGNTINTHTAEINNYISSEKPIVISISFVPENIDIDYAYFSNPRRYDYHLSIGKLANKEIILTSNVETSNSDDIIIPIEKIMKGSDDNSAMLLLNLLDYLGVEKIALAGFDGFSDDGDSYVTNDLERNVGITTEKNAKIRASLTDFMSRKTVPTVQFITPSRFESTL